MIKDIVVNLSPGATRDVAAHYAVSIAEACGAHVAGIAFAYDPVLPASVMGGISADVFDVQRRENEKMAHAVIEQFESAAKRAGVSAESQMLTATIAGAADMFAALARRFDLAVALNAKGDRQGALDELLTIIRKDRAFNDDAARKQLLQLFDAWGAADPVTISGRQRLSSLLFA